jgi:hypothetical protein
MTNDEFQEMLALFIKLDKLLKKYEKCIYSEDVFEEKPSTIVFPDDVYDEICIKLDIKELGLIGIS